MELGNGYDSISVDGARSEGLMQGGSGFSGDVWRASKVAKADADVVTYLDSSSLPYFHHMEAAQYKNSGYYSCGGGLDASSGDYLLNPFTPSQWLELEQQALIYKYIIANEPIPIHLLIPIRKAFESAGFYTFNGGWGPFHQGYSTSTDPEPGQCRRTDGKKWRCSRDAVVNQKYCENHMNRGRRRSRKHVEGHDKSSNTNKMPYVNLNSSRSSSSITRQKTFIQQQPELNGFISQSGETNWKPISWEATIGGPLAEAFQSGDSTDESKTNSALSLLPKDCKLSSSSPIGFLQKGTLVSPSDSSTGSTNSGSLFFQNSSESLL